MYKVEVSRKSGNAQALRQAIRKQGGEVVLKHALAMASVAYQIYPVGPPHKDGTPHTRDTFAVLHSGVVIADKGQFSHATKGFEFDSSPGGGEMSIARGLTFIAKGASFFLEFGTIYMEPQPILRMLIKRAKVDITNDLRKLNIRAGSL